MANVSLYVSGDNPNSPNISVTKPFAGSDLLTALIVMRDMLTEEIDKMLTAAGVIRRFTSAGNSIALSPRDPDEVLVLGEFEEVAGV